MGLLLLAYLLASLTESRKNDILYGDIISFNNLNDEKNLRYYGSGSPDKCYWWYFLSEDFFEIVYLGGDEPAKRRKGGKAEKGGAGPKEKPTGVEKGDEVAGKGGVDRRDPPGRSITITSDDICASEILILLNKKKAACKSVSSFFVRVNSQGEEKKYIAVEYLVSSQIYMVSSGIVMYKNQNESKNLYIISDSGKKISILETSHFNLFFDERYLQHAHVKHGRGELELQLRTKGKVGKTRVIIALPNKCKPLFFVVTVFVYEWLSLLPHGVDFPEGALVRLILRRERPPAGKNNHTDYESGNVHDDAKYSDGDRFSCTALTKRHVLRASPLRRRVTISSLLSKHVEGRHPIRRSTSVRLTNCIRKNYVEISPNGYQIQQSRSYDIVSEEVLKIKEGTSGRSLHIIVKNLHSGQVFSSRVNIHRVAKSKLACFGFIGGEPPGSGTPNRGAVEGEIEMIRAHFFYREHYYVDNLHVESFFQPNAQAGQTDGGEKLTLRRKYLCLMQLYGEGGAKLHGVYTSGDVKLTVSSKSHKLSVLPLHFFPEYGAYYFMPIRKGGEVSLEMTYRGDYASRKDLFISAPVKCHVKGGALSMSTLFVLPGETIRYQCTGGGSTANRQPGSRHPPNKRTLKLYNWGGNLDAHADETKLHISVRKPPPGGSTPPQGNSHRRRHTKGTPPSGKNRFDIICLLICDDPHLNNCFLSTVYVGDRVVHLSAIAQKSILEENEVTNVYIFMRLGWMTMKAQRAGGMALLKRGQNGRFKRREALQGGTPISSCFDVVRHHMKIKHDRNYLEVVKKHAGFLKLEGAYQNACAYYQLRGKREKRKIPLRMEYTQERSVDTQMTFGVFKKVKGIICHDFVCSKFVKFGQMAHLIVYDGFAVTPHRVSISSEGTFPELTLKRNRFLNERRGLPAAAPLFSRLFLGEKFQSEFYLSEQRMGIAPHRNIFTGELFHENAKEQYIPVWRLYNRRLFEYDFRPKWGVPPRGRRSKGSPFHREGTPHSVFPPAKGHSPPLPYEPFFPIKQYYTIRCDRGEKKHVTLNILVKMKTWGIGTPQVVTENHLPVHFKYPSSIQVTIFSKYVQKLQMVEGSKLTLYKNVDYYMKAFLVDEDENVILTNEPFRYTLEEDPSSGDLLKMCLKGKSSNFQMTKEKRKNLIKTNSKILINCSDEGVEKDDMGGPPNGMNPFAACSAGKFLLTVEYSSRDGEGGAISHHFQKYVFLHFCERMRIWYEDHLVLFFSPHVYYSLPICTSVDSGGCPLHALRYSVRGTNRISVLPPPEGEKLRGGSDHHDVGGHHNVSGHHVKRTKPRATIVDLERPKSPPEKCTRVYVNSSFQANAILTIQNMLVHEMDHLEIRFSFSKLARVEVSLLARNAEGGDQMAVPMRVQFFDKYNRKVSMLPTQELQVKLTYDYNKRVEMTPLSWSPEGWNEQADQLQTPQRSTTEKATAVSTDMFFQLRSSHEGKYYIQVEVKYKLANRLISIWSNMTRLIVYSRGVSLYGGGNSILIHSYQQTVEIPVQLCHPLIHKVVCLSKNEKLVAVEGVFKLPGEKCIHVCSIKSGSSVGKTALHVFPIFESYYTVFSQQKGRANLKNIQKLEADFHDVEKYYHHYVEHRRGSKKCHITDAHTCEEVEEEKKLRKFFFLKFDVTVDYVRSMRLFAEDTIRLVPNEEVETFARFYGGGGDARPFLSLDFRLIYERTAELFQVEYFVNDGSVLLGGGERDGKAARQSLQSRQSHGQPDGPPPARRTIVTDLRVSPDAFLSIVARSEGRFFLYANFTKYSGSSHQGEVIHSQVYNLVVQRRETQRIALPVVHLSSSGVYKFDRSFHCLAILAHWTYEQRLPLSAGKNVRTERRAITHNAHYRNGHENIYKKFLVNITEISSLKVFNYCGKFIPLNVVQYLSIRLYSVNMERVLPPLNGQLYVHVSHPTVLTVRTLGPNHLFVVPHRMGCSFVLVRFELHPGGHPAKGPLNNGRTNPRADLPPQAGGQPSPTTKMHLCVTKRVPTKYFRRRKNCYYLNRVYKLLGRYSHRFFEQPYLCVDSVSREEAKVDQVSSGLLSKSNFNRAYKHDDAIYMVNEFEDLFQPPTGHLSVINDHCSGLKL
ncbi:hypothetical protein, conserved [Plasmodium vivax]|uniref:Uncharacterized protein n=1 Tax=Plasmodium vivax (strain Salvador I) TaxID=126793 RepID=A5KAK6_PLAVS|nr:hypothetical protein, conserved [Plasmodium vivax]EDL43605.1 hypothetical protein, conserved [Plasmodium vivax]|eukprot:XP_001613332.1 hypothetical protein [Plasmodium vivax Sal-1]